MTPDSPDYEDAHKALKIVESATDHVNKLMGQHENFKQLLQLQQRFDNFNDLIKPGRRLIKEGIVIKKSRKFEDQRYLILLSDSLIVGKIICYKVYTKIKKSL